MLAFFSLQFTTNITTVYLKFIQKVGDKRVFTEREKTYSLMFHPDKSYFSMLSYPLRLHGKGCFCISISGRRYTPILPFFTWKVSMSYLFVVKSKPFLSDLEELHPTQQQNCMVVSFVITRKSTCHSFPSKDSHGNYGNCPKRCATQVTESGVPLQGNDNNNVVMSLFYLLYQAEHKLQQRTKENFNFTLICGKTIAFSMGVKMEKEKIRCVISLSSWKTFFFLLGSVH